VKDAFILRTEVQPVKGDADVFLRIRVWRREGCRCLSFDGRWIANERINEQSHVVGETHRVGVRVPANEDREAKGRRILDRSLLPYVLEAAHNRIERHSFFGRKLVFGHWDASFDFQAMTGQSLFEEDTPPGHEVQSAVRNHPFHARPDARQRRGRLRKWHSVGQILARDK
jgi:hypothetical protein